MADPTEEVPTPPESEPKNVTESVATEASKAKKKRNKKKKKKISPQLLEEIAIKVLEGIKPVEVDPKAIESTNNEFKKGGLNQYKFWQDQPVPQFSGAVEGRNDPIREKIPVDQVQNTPYPLNNALEWSVININDPAQMDELYELLHNNYVEDSSCTFRFDYSREFLKWALTPPGWLQQWHMGIRGKDKKKLLAFISAIPANLRSFNKEIPLVEINFLCVHKGLRDKRLAPTLIQEITRQVDLTNRWQAVYTAGKLLPRPVAVCRYYHRSLNPIKLVDIGFSYMSQRTTKSMLVKLYRLPTSTQIPGIRIMQDKDCQAVHTLLNNYLLTFKIAPIFTEEEVRHFLLPRPMVLNSYVVEDPETKEVTDFISFYTLPSTIIGNPKYTNLKAAYAFYYVPHKHTAKELMQDALFLAKQDDFDVFNALDLMENSTFLEDLKFGIGDGKLRYYLYNWDVPTIAPGDLGLVLT